MLVVASGEARQALSWPKDLSGHNKPPNVDLVVGHLEMVSHDIAVERVTGIEPA